MSDTVTCDSDTCDSRAVAKVFWPGDEPKNFCQACVCKIRTVSACMGAYVRIEALEGYQEIKLSDLEDAASNDEIKA